MKPDGKIKRAEFVAILLCAANVLAKPVPTNFSDVHDAVTTASSMKLIYGKEAGRFAPNEKITRAEISAILNRFFKNTIDFNGEFKAFTDIGSSWAKTDIEKISQAGFRRWLWR